jgi:1-deoxy-D-xylulose-5-phosphate reductoisomerase
MKKTISILGSTGSIGKSTLDIVEKKKSYFKIKLLSSNKNIKLIINQIKRYKPEYFIVNDHNAFKKIEKKYKKKKIKIFNNFNQIKFKNDICVSAIPGIAGLEPTIKLTKMSKKILIANKESIICGWHLIKNAAKKNKSKIIPIDSEHFSILKLLENHKPEDIDKIYITASGGPFLNYNLDKLKSVKPKEALKHPKWKMGKKISIDSATLMNKILEFIEAQKLFNLSVDKLDIIIHPESLVHAIIKLKNGLSKLIYHQTTMKIPLANAIFNENVQIKSFYKYNSVTKNKNYFENLSFYKVNDKVFSVYKLKNIVNKYPSSSIIINAVNEALVELFLKKKIRFLAISKTIKTIMNDSNYIKYAIIKPTNLKIIYKINNWAKNKTLEKTKNL